MAVQSGDTATKTAGERFNESLLPDHTDQDICQPRSNNVLKAGETYYVFFLYVKARTEQTYQVYVGPEFDRPR